MDEKTEQKKFNKVYFETLYKKYITRDGADALLEWLRGSDFFYAPASTRFHGNYEGGLCTHSINVYNALIKRLFCAENPTTYSEETAAIVALLHDLCKVNLYKKDFRNVKEDGAWVQKEVYTIDEKFPCGDHADKSIILIQQFMKLEPDEIFAIRAHMGFSDNAFRGGAQFINRIFGRCPLAVHLHIADMEATYLMGE